MDAADRECIGELVKFIQSSGARSRDSVFADVGIKARS